MKSSLYLELVNRPSPSPGRRVVVKHNSGRNREDMAMDCVEKEAQPKKVDGKTLGTSLATYFVTCILLLPSHSHLGTGC